jgi:P pilus assembly chaperone PapD
MLKSTSILTLLLALGVFSAGSILTNFAPLGATVAYAENENDSQSGIENDDDEDFVKDHRVVSGDDSNDDNEDSDDAGAVGTSIGPVFSEGAAPDPACKEPACKIK